MENQKQYAVVTGASKGLGKSYAIQLAERGHNLILVSIKDDGLSSVSDFLLKTYEVDIICYEVDLTNLDELKELISNIKDHYKVNILINNAGMGAACAFGDESADFLNRMINLNVRALTMLCHELLPLLEEQDEAYILNVASMIAFSPSGFKSVYPASKTYVHNFSMCLAEELKDKGIHVSVVYPGAMRTNKFICRRIEKHGPLAKSGVVSTHIMAKESLRKMFNKKRVIIIGWGNYIMWILMMIVPLSIKLSLITNAMRKEVLMTTTETEIS